MKNKVLKDFSDCTVECHCSRCAVKLIPVRRDGTRGLKPNVEVWWTLDPRTGRYTQNNLPEGIDAECHPFCRRCSISLRKELLDGQNSAKAA